MSNFTDKFPGNVQRLVPMLIAPYAQYTGLSWTPLLAVPALVLLVAILRRIPDVRFAHGPGTAGFGALPPYAGPLALLWAAVVIRTIVAIGYSTFLPVLLTRRANRTVHRFWVGRV